MISSSENASSPLSGSEPDTLRSCGALWWPVLPVTSTACLPPMEASAGVTRTPGARIGATDALLSALMIPESRWIHTRVLNCVLFICGCGNQPFITWISKVEASRHCPEYWSPSGSLMVNSESMYSMFSTSVSRISFDTFVGLSKRILNTSPLPNSVSPSSGSSAKTSVRRGDSNGDLP